MSTQRKGQDGAPPSTLQREPHPKSHELFTCTIKAPSFSYAHLSVVREDGEHCTPDNIQLKSWCSAALNQFLGVRGAAIPIDILKVEDEDCWLRVPRQDLSAFAAAITAWPGARDDGTQVMLRIRQCSDWLGAMVGGNGQEQLWNS